MSGTLFVVATPIGNLEDITLRALRMLREVDLIAAEDTRRTGNLLRHYEIRARMVSLHAHNEGVRLPQILQHLQAGRSVALVSDAGTPGISDPGAEIVAGARAAGYPVVPIPGPSALAAILSVSGISDAPVTFAGFPPNRSNARTKWLHHVASLAEHSVIWYEAPHRLHRTLNELGPLLGNRPILAGREITKLHEEWHVGSPEQLIAAFARPVGEFVLLIEPAKQRAAPGPGASDEDVWQLFRQLTHSNPALARRVVVKQVAEQLGLSARAAYAAIERASKSVD